MKSKIKCIECGKYYHQITLSHLKKCCDLTTRQYMGKYPDAEMASEEYKQNLSESHKGKKLTDEHKQKIGESGKGRKHTNEAKEKMSDSHKGKKHTEESIQKMSESHKGHECSDVTKQKIGDGNRGKIVSEESKQKIKVTTKKSYENGRIPGMKGKKHLQETKQKIGESKRISRIKEIKEKNGYVFPNFSLKACEVFDWLNNEFKLNGQHAMNGGEYHIMELGYFVDYYEPTLNLVIEWDEIGHYDLDGNLRERDIRRQKEIEEYLECKFIRIKEDTNLVGEFKNG